MGSNKLAFTSGVRRNKHKGGGGGVYQGAVGHAPHENCVWVKQFPAIQAYPWSYSDVCYMYTFYFFMRGLF